VITVRITAPFATLRKPLARSYGETYEDLTAQAARQVLLSLVGEPNRNAYPDTVLKVKSLTKPRIATTIQRMSQVKYGVPGKSPRPEYLEVLCGVDALIQVEGELANRVRTALERPEEIERFGCLSMGLSDDICEVWLVR
jgi:CRISPR-associated protein Cas5t